MQLLVFNALGVQLASLGDSHVKVFNFVCPLKFLLVVGLSHGIDFELQFANAPLRFIVDFSRIVKSVLQHAYLPGVFQLSLIFGHMRVK